MATAFTPVQIGCLVLEALLSASAATAIIVMASRQPAVPKPAAANASVIPYRIFSTWKQANVNDGGTNYLSSLDGKLVASSNRSQMWILTAQANNTYTIQTPNGEALTAATGIASGSNISVSKYESLPTQMWVVASFDASNTSIFKSGQPLRISPAGDTQKCMDLFNPGTVTTTTNATVGLWGLSTDKPNQQWILE